MKVMPTLRHPVVVQASISTVLSALFHFISLHRPALSQPSRNVNVWKLLKSARSVGIQVLFTFPNSINYNFGISAHNF